MRADQPPNFPIVSVPQAQILTCLAQQWPVAIAQIDIAVHVDIQSRSTVRRHLEQLVDAGLVERSPQLRGHFATALGRQLVDFLCTQNEHGMTTE